MDVSAFHELAIELAVEAGADPVRARERMAQLAQVYAVLRVNPMCGHPAPCGECAACYEESLRDDEWDRKRKGKIEDD